MHDLAQGIDAADAAFDRVAAYRPFDRDPRIAPAEPPQGVPCGDRRPAGNERVAQRRAEYDGSLRRALRRGFDPAQPDSQLPDAGGVGRAQLLELGAAEAERLHRGGLLAQPCAVAFDFGGEGGLVVGQTPAFPAGVAAGAAGADEQRRRQDGVAEKEFFHD